MTPTIQYLLALLDDDKALWSHLEKVGLVGAADYRYGSTRPWYDDSRREILCVLAFRLRDEEPNWRNGALAVYRHVSKSPRSGWRGCNWYFAEKAQAKHFIIAALIAKEFQKG